MIPRLNVGGALARLRAQRDDKRAADEQFVSDAPQPTPVSAGLSPAVRADGDTPLVVAIAVEVVGRSGGIGVSFARGEQLDSFYMHACAPSSADELRKFADQWARMVTSQVRAPRVYATSGRAFDAAQRCARLAATFHPEPMKHERP